MSPSRPNAFAQRFSGFGAPNAQTDIIAELQTVQRHFTKRKEFIREGDSISSAYMLHRGWMCAYKRLPDGGRQVVEILMPGDFVGLRGLFLQTSDCNVEALTDVVVSEITRNRLIAAMRKSSELTGALLWAFAQDEAIVMQHLVNLGRRNALARTAHFLLELGFLAHKAGEGTLNSYDCPLSQQLLADALGITSIHLNRILRYLREKKLLTIAGGKVIFHNAPLLKEVAGFDQSYLE
jgi:CRP-like cAMP-binding protein